ncbi:MAG: F0F1 ATP synthase subunit delta [Lachnospiraceae bacterium]|nr:F0F1 ATP synthase subunit delta [Lachnospiraceae bacterium]
MAKLISKTYGEALFELAVEENKVDSFAEETAALQQILRENEELGRLMNHPKIIKEEKLQVLKNIFEGKMDKELLGFLSLLITKDRYQEADSILQYFLDQVKELRGVGVAYVTTAEPLKDAQKQQIVEKLLETTKYRQMEMHYAQDQTLIGGMVIRIGDRVVDSSIKTKLEELQKQLLKVQLNF